MPNDIRLEFPKKINEFLFALQTKLNDFYVFEGITFSYNISDVYSDSGLLDITVTVSNKTVRCSIDVGDYLDARISSDDMASDMFDNIQFLFSRVDT